LLASSNPFANKPHKTKAASTVAGTRKKALDIAEAESKGAGRTPSAFSLYVKATSAQHFTSGQPFAEGVRRAGAAWKALGDAERAPYLQRAQAAKDVKAADPAGAKRRKKSATAGDVPRALTAYAIFIQQTSSRWFAGGATGKDALRRAGEAWGAMSDTEKAPYVALALKSKLAAAAARGEAEKKADAERAPLTAYAAFVAETVARRRDEEPGGEPRSGKQRLMDAAAAWRGLPESEKVKRQQAASSARAEWAAARAREA
jgi:hypothetical protein